MDAQTWLTLAVAILGTLSTATVAIWTQRRASLDRQQDRAQDAAEREADRRHASTLDRAAGHREASAYWREARLRAYTDFLAAAKAEAHGFDRVSMTEGPIDWDHIPMGETGLDAAIATISLLGSDQVSDLVGDFAWALGHMWADLAARDDSLNGFDEFTVGHRAELRARIRDFELAARADLSTGTPAESKELEWPPGAERMVTVWQGTAAEVAADGALPEAPDEELAGPAAPEPRA